MTSRTVIDLLEKASRAAASARLLLGAGDTDGACSRAYYAMFDAARAALVTKGIMPESIKTHHSVIRHFSLEFVKQGPVPYDVGRSLNSVQAIREIADYEAAEVPPDKADWCVRQSEVFLDTVLGLPDVQAQMGRKPTGPQQAPR